MAFADLHKNAKRAINSLALLLAVAVGSTALPASPARAQDITTGLIARWTMDETSGSSIHDSSPNSNTGTWSDGDDNNVSGESAAGHISNGLTFDGTNDHITIPDSASTSFSNSDNFTISAWVKLNSCQADGSRIFEKKQSGAENIMISCSSSDNLPNFQVQDSNNITADIKGSTPINDNNWHHIIGVREGNDIRIYINSTPEGSSSASFTGDFLDGDILIGYSTDGGVSLVNGMIDEIRIYNRALSNADINALYSYTGSTTCASPSGQAGEISYNYDNNVMQYCNGFRWVAVGPASNLGTNLIGHWKMDETGGNAISDSSANNLNGTWIDNDDNNVLSESTAGSINSAIAFDNTDDYINIPDASNIMDTGMPVTISAWIYPTDFSTNNAIFATDVDGTNYNGYFVIIEQSTGTIRLEYGSGGGKGPANRRTASGSLGLNLNQWNHFTGIIRGPTDMSIYINGVKDTSLSYSGTGGNVTFSNSGGLIGNAHNNVYFSGAIDDVRFYNRELGPFEISSLHAMGASCYEPESSALIGHWAMDETAGASIADSSGNNRAGTWSDADDNDVSGETTAGPNATALTLDGTDDVITIADSAAFDFGANDFAVTFWVNKHSPTSAWDNSAGIGKWNNGSSPGTNEWLLGLGGNASGGNDEQPAFNIESGNVKYNAVSPDILSLNQWHHLTGVREGKNIKIYVDGQLKASAPIGNIDVNNAGRNIIIGNYATYFTNATYDDTRIYNRALNPLEISSLYGATGGVCTVSTCSNPIGVKGEILFNTTYNLMQYCNGGQWIAMGPVSDGGASCSSPSGLAGELRYDSNNNTLMYCEGDEWISVISPTP